MYVEWRISMPNNILFRTAAFIIKNNKLLFCKNANSPYYYLVGGGIEKNETSEEAVTREILEETGLKLETDKLVIIQERFIEADKQKFHEIRFFYSVKNSVEINIEDGTFTDQGKDETLHWFPIDKLNEYSIVPEFLKTFSFSDMHEIKHIVVREF
jgi:ADP-ribose pyrophosphatase YjhB (NUDIX family)